MKHLLPDLMSLLRTDMSILDSSLSMPSIPSTTGLADAIPLFNTSPYLLIQDDGPSLGYIAVSDVLQEMMHAHRLMEAYFETTLETAGSALTLINEEAKVTYWTSGAEHVFSINKKISSANRQRISFPGSPSIAQNVIYRGNCVSKAAPTKTRSVRPD